MLIDAIIEPFQLTFMMRALVVCVLIGVMCPFLGAHVINREMGFMGDALAHSVLPGMVGATILGFSPLLGAIPTGIVVALTIGYIVKKSNVSNDTSIGIMFTALFALGLVLLSLHGDEEIHVEDILLGQITTISNTDVLVTVFLALVTFTIMVLLHKQLVFVGFDYEGAVVAGLPASRIDYLLLALLSVVIVVSLQIVGIILVVGMLITPAAAASLIAKRFSSAIVLGIVFGVTSGVVGLYMSYYFNLPSGPAIALTSTAIFTLSFLNRLRTT